MRANQLTLGSKVYKPELSKITCFFIKGIRQEGEKVIIEAERNEGWGSEKITTISTSHVGVNYYDCTIYFDLNAAQNKQLRMRKQAIKYQNDRHIKEYEELNKITALYYNQPPTDATED